MDDIELELCDFDNEVTDKLNSVQTRNKNLKTKQVYKKIVHNDIIVWYSDNI